MLCFSSSRWPLVVSSGTRGVLPGPLWLWFSSGTGLMVAVRGFVMAFSPVLTETKRGSRGDVSRKLLFNIASRPAGAFANPVARDNIDAARLIAGRWNVPDRWSAAPAAARDRACWLRGGRRGSRRRRRAGRDDRHSD